MTFQFKLDAHWEPHTHTKTLKSPTIVEKKLWRYHPKLGFFFFFFSRAAEQNKKKKKMGIFVSFSFFAVAHFHFFFFCFWLAGITGALAIGAAVRSIQDARLALSVRATKRSARCISRPSSSSPPFREYRGCLYTHTHTTAVVEVERECRKTTSFLFTAVRLPQGPQHSGTPLSPPLSSIYNPNNWKTVSLGGKKKNKKNVRFSGLRVAFWSQPSRKRK